MRRVRELVQFFVLATFKTRPFAALVVIGFQKFKIF